MAKKKVVAKPMTQKQVIDQLAMENDMTSKQVKLFFASVAKLIQTELNPKSKKAPGVCVLPGIARVKARHRPAKPARKGRNPFNGEEVMFKAKPASTVIKILPVKALKDTVN